MKFSTSDFISTTSKFYQKHKNYSQKNSYQLFSSEKTENTITSTIKNLTTLQTQTRVKTRKNKAHARYDHNLDLNNYGRTKSESCFISDKINDFTIPSNFNLSSFSSLSNVNLDMTRLDKPDLTPIKDQIVLINEQNTLDGENHSVSPNFTRTKTFLTDYSVQSSVNPNHRNTSDGSDLSLNSSTNLSFQEKLFSFSNNNSIVGYLIVGNRWFLFHIERIE